MLLFLNDIAGSEILLILVFILIFFGSKSIPGIARTMGRTIRQIKDASSDLQNEIKKSGGDMKKDLNLDAFNLDGIIRETSNDIQRPLDQYTSDLENAVKFERPRNSQIPSNESSLGSVQVAETKKESDSTQSRKETSLDKNHTGNSED